MVSGVTDTGDTGLDRLAPVGRETVQDQIYGQLRNALICGQFDAGEPFVVADIARRMSVSAMPVREALARLASERALEAMPNRRIRVPLLTLERARDIARARALIEGDLAARAMKGIARDDLVRLYDLTAEYEKADGPHHVARLNHAFHFLIYTAAGSTVLLPFVESLWMQAGPYVRAAARLYQPDTLASATQHHRGILQAITAGDGDAVARELRADINQAFGILERADVTSWATED